MEIVGGVFFFFKNFFSLKSGFSLLTGSVRQLVSQLCCLFVWKFWVYIQFIHHLLNRYLFVATVCWDD